MEISSFESCSFTLALSSFYPLNVGVCCFSEECIDLIYNTEINNPLNEYTTAGSSNSDSSSLAMEGSGSHWSPIFSDQNSWWQITLSNAFMDINSIDFMVANADDVMIYALVEGSNILVKKVSW